ANPYEIGIFYSIDGLVYEPGCGITITEVNGEKRKLSNGGYAGSGPDGHVGTVTADILTTASEGEHTLTLVLPQVGVLSSDIVIDLKVNPASFRHLYQIKELHYEETISGVTIKSNRVIYAPADIWVDFSIIGEKPVSFYDFSIDEIYLTMDGKTKIATTGGVPGVFRFPRPNKVTDDAKLVINNTYLDPLDRYTENLVAIEGPWEIPLPLPDDSSATEPITYTEPIDVSQYFASLKEALDAVMAQEAKEFYFESAIFDYRSPAAYEQKLPVYILLLREGKITDGMSATKVYEVAEDITDHGETMIPFSLEGLEVLQQKQTERIEACLDRTHEVVALAKAQGRDLAEESFLLGNSLKGYYNGDWFIISFNESSMPQAAYNIVTNEVIVAADNTGMSFSDGQPVKK
ncbi:MAG: hypothetical protein NUK65_13440, partial [Firmicutes bacterium]|nr:hypothetical protein [Bacillota bacterium]